MTEPLIYTDPTALSLDGATETSGIAYDHEAPWDWAHRWRPNRPTAEEANA